MFYEYTFGTSVCIYYKTVEGERALGGERRISLGSCIRANFSRSVVTHHISWAIQRAVLAATSNSGSLPQQGTYRRLRLSPSVVIILADVNFFSIVFVCELQTTVVSL